MKWSIFFLNWSTYIALCISSSAWAAFSRSCRELRHGYACVIDRAVTINAIKFFSKIQIQTSDSLWEFMSHDPPKYPQTSVFVRWQWKSMSKTDDVDIDTKNGWILFNDAKDTDSTNVFASLYCKREISTESSEYITHITHWITFRLLTVLCGKINRLTTATGLISFLSGSMSISSKTEMVNVCIRLQTIHIKTYHHLVSILCAIDTFVTIVPCTHPIFSLYTLPMPIRIRISFPDW